MAFTAPDADDLKARFPRFSSVADSAIDAALGDASKVVDDSWLSQEDFTAGRLLYAAHILTLDGHGTGTGAAITAAGLDDYKTIKSGDLSLTKDDGDFANSKDILDKTTYGRRFKEVRNRNVGGPFAAVKSTSTIK